MTTLAVADRAVVNAAGTSAAPAGAPAIRVDRLSVVFGDTVRAVDEVSFDVAQGEFLSIVGPSGCGKTSILNVLTGLVTATGGSVEILGGPPRAGRPDIAYMLARDSLLPWRTTLANAMFGMEIRGVPGAEARERAARLLAEVGLGAFGEAYPKHLSHGMRQRCALARTFCLDAPVLLMDEPFGALDAQTKLQLEDVLLGLWSRERRTVVFITHDLAEAIALSDRVIVMSPRPGSILADLRVPLERPRSVRALQRDPGFHALYSRLWELLEGGVATAAGAHA